MTRRGRRRTALLLVVGPLLVVGCDGPHERRAEAERAAIAFERALRSGDGAAACRALAPGTRSELEQSAGALCPRAVLEEVTPTSRVRHTDVQGHRSRVVLASDTLFLARFAAGWKVTAAGCEPRSQERPYDCAVEGG